MKPAAFDYERVDTEAEAVERLAQTGSDARLLAGGLSLMAMLNMRLLSPELILDISRIAQLQSIGLTRGGTYLEVGAGVTQAALAQWPGLANHCPLLALALPFVGHYQTRSRGTVGGSLCHADPSSELPLCLATLRAEVLLSSNSGQRTRAAAAFQTGMLSTAVQSDELLSRVHWPVAADGVGYGFNEVALRHGDFAIVAIAACVSAQGTVLGVGGVADRPVVIELPALTDSDLEDALNDVAWRLPADSDQHASARYRRELVRRIGKRTIEEARAWGA
jgi:2-furoyl-CoA dehydrogenase FAD binding subunit